MTEYYTGDGYEGSYYRLDADNYLRCIECQGVSDRYDGDPANLAKVGGIYATEYDSDGEPIDPRIIGYVTVTRDEAIGVEVSIHGVGCSVGAGEAK